MAAADKSLGVASATGPSTDLKQEMVTPACPTRLSSSGGARTR